MKCSGRDQSGRPLLKPVAPATVNRTLEYLRAALFHARDHHNAHIKSLKIRKLAEPKARVREANFGEEAAIFGAMRDDFRDILDRDSVRGLRELDLAQRRL
jgi:hypothetical protein